MVAITRVVLDVLKPHAPEVLAFGERTAGCDGVDGVNVVLLETDREVQNIKLTIEGQDLDFEDVEATLEDLGGTIHSIDEVACGEVLVEESETHQDTR